MDRSKLIVIEGACDGIGKSTQFSLLCEKLSALGVKVATHHFPSYDTPQGALVEAYLKGEFGEAKSLSPYLVESLYAVDRALTWKSELSHREGEVVLLDRYTTSSLIYQSAYITDPAEKKAFICYVNEHEYGRLGVPKPDLVIFLDAPFETAAALRAARKENDGVANDIHESSSDFMKLVYDSAQFVCEAEGWSRVSCADGGGGMRSREDIHRDVCVLAGEVLGIKL